MDTYHDLISQTFDFPTADFTVQDNELRFHDIPLMDIVEKHGTPLRLTYLPKISSQIQRAKKWFADAIEQTNYQGTYSYCLLHQVVALQLRAGGGPEKRYSPRNLVGFDISIIRKLHRAGQGRQAEATSSATVLSAERYKKEISPNSSTRAS